MSQQNRPFKQELEQYNNHLDGCLKERFGMTLKLFKIIKALTQLVGAAAGIYAMHQGADPLTAFALVAFIISGPEALEYMINETGNGSD